MSVWPSSMRGSVCDVDSYVNIQAHAVYYRRWHHMCLSKLLKMLKVLPRLTVSTLRGSISAIHPTLVYSAHLRWQSSDKQKYTMTQPND
jgi:hypothetical protein